MCARVYVLCVLARRLRNTLFLAQSPKRSEFAAPLFGAFFCYLLRGCAFFFFAFHPPELANGNSFILKWRRLHVLLFVCVPVTLTPQGCAEDAELFRWASSPPNEMVLLAAPCAGCGRHTLCAECGPRRGGNGTFKKKDKKKCLLCEKWDGRVSPCQAKVRRPKLSNPLHSYLIWIRSRALLVSLYLISHWAGVFPLLFLVAPKILTVCYVQVCTWGTHEV